MASITIKNLTKAFGDMVVLKEFSEVFKDGAFITLLGPSGCGKTTMLRIIAGFEKPTAGEVLIDDQVVSSASVFVPPEKREIGMVFQSYAVRPHMNVFDNVACPLKIKGMDKGEIQRRVTSILEIVHLSRYADRMPNQLSGGQQQRVALGRALVAESSLLLLDEPLSNLDAKLRESMRCEIKEIQRRLEITVVYVTHDQVEAMTMSDRVFVINQGVVQQIGSSMEIYCHPVNQFAANFAGKVNFLRGTAGNGRVELQGIHETLPYDGPVSGPAVVAIRPENIRITESAGHLKGVIESVFFLGDENDCRIKAGDSVLRVITEPETLDETEIGRQVSLEFKSFIVYTDDGWDDHNKILT